MPVTSFNKSHPVISLSCFIAPSAWVIGDVSLGEQVTILFGAVLRGDLEAIVIGNQTNIQDNVVLHTTFGNAPTILEDQVSIGHGALLHSCTVRSGAMVGMRSTILDNAEIGEHAMIGAHSLVPPRMKIPAFSLAYGSPAKVIRHLTDSEIKGLKDVSDRYVRIGATYKSMGLKECV